MKTWRGRSLLMVAVLLPLGFAGFRMMAAPSSAPPAESTIGTPGTLGSPVLTGAATPAPTPSATNTPSPTPTPFAPDPATPVGKQLAWILARVNEAAEEIDDDVLAKRFSEDFFAGLPPDDLVIRLRDLGNELAPVALGRFEGAASGTDAVALLTTGVGQPWKLTIGVEEQKPHRIVDLLFEPWEEAVVPDGAPQSWKQFDRELQAIAPTVNFLAAEIVDGDCRPVHALNADEPLAIASSFKLYVLGELARQVAAGTAAWDEELAIKEDWKSSPSGWEVMRYEQAGRRFTLRDFAANMISLSDNTATDHLMRRLGREQLEAFLATAGHADPSVNVPFLFTREWFMLKTGLTEEQVETYLEAAVPKKRELLTTDVAEGDLAVAESAYWEEPIRIETIEWFASATDLCRVMATLQTMSERPALEPIQGLLSNRPGTTFDVDAWTYVGHKGGDETGVFNRTWLLRRTDGRWFVLTAGLNDPEVPVASGTAAQLLVAAADLLANSP